MKRLIPYEEAMDNRGLLDEIIDINESNGDGRNIELIYENNREWVIKPDREE